MKILVVDDSMTMRRIVIKCLKAMGHTDVVQAADGKEALKKVEETSDLGMVLSDWNMPEMNGYDFLVEFRKDEKNSDIPFLMVTTESEKEAIIKALGAGANNYVLKPFDQEGLAEKITQTLKKMGKA